MKKDFIRCGVAGWCMEVIWTALAGIKNRDRKLKGSTSIWMFPIYGLGVMIKPLSKKMKGKSVAFRGMVYTLCIYAVEFTSGILLKRKNCCPWNYKCKLNFKEVIRLDYAPLWFVAGLILEKIVTEDRADDTRYVKSPSGTVVKLKVTKKKIST